MTKAIDGGDTLFSSPPPPLFTANAASLLPLSKMDGETLRFSSFSPLLAHETTDLLRSLALLYPSLSLSVKPSPRGPFGSPRFA